MTHPLRRPSLGWSLLALVAAACGATPNRTSGLADVRTPDPVAAERSAETTAPRPDTLENEVIEPAATESATGSSALVIAYVAGEPLYAADLLALWLRRESPEVREYLEELILDRLVHVESKRLGISVSDSELDATMKDAREQIAAEIKRVGSDLSVDDFIQRRLGLDPAGYMAAVRSERHTDMLAERCVRAWLMSQERAEVRAIVVEDEEQVQDIQRELAQGADFSALAREHSIEGSAQAGGRIPPVVRANTMMARFAFATPVGQVGGPFFEQGRYVLIKVDSRPAVYEGPWSEVGDRIEASLAEHAIEDPEYWQWKSAMLEGYEVDMGPFLRLVGEPEEKARD